METLKQLFRTAKANTGQDHTEWIETNRGDLRLFASTDWLSGIESEIQAETEQGEVIELSELDIDILEQFKELLSDDRRYICTNCGGGFKHSDMVFDEDNENDFCKDCK